MTAPTEAGAGVGSSLPIEAQRWDRRGTMVYGEDSGPGTAQFVADYPTMIEAQWAVDSHNKNLSGAQP